MVKFALPRAEVFVYEDDVSGQVEGFIDLYDDYIAGSFVRELSRLKGIGKKLLDHAKCGNTLLRLQVFCKNVRGVRFYQREKFIIQGKTQTKAPAKKSTV